jgi:GT2 family glycosyltransferase
LISAPAPADAGHARNVGVQAARAELLAFCDADDRVRPDWLAELVEGLGRYAIVGGVLDHSRVNQPLLASFYGEPVDEVRWGFLPSAGTANLAIRRVLFDALGGFRTDFAGGYEDYDLCWRAQLQGEELGWAHGAVVDRLLKASTAPEMFGLWLRRGLGNALLYKRFKAAGMPRPSMRDVVWDVAMIMRGLPFGGRRRLLAARLAGLHLGRLRGSVRHRVAYV